MFSNIFSSKRLKGRAIIALAAVFIAVVFLEVWAVNRLATYGEQLSKIDDTINQYKLENNLLENEIALRSSLKRMEKITRNLGFEYNPEVEYLKD